MVSKVSNVSHRRGSVVKLQPGLRWEPFGRWSWWGYDGDHCVASMVKPPGVAGYAWSLNHHRAAGSEREQKDAEESAARAYREETKLRRLL